MYLIFHTRNVQVWQWLFWNVLFKVENLYTNGTLMTVVDTLNASN